MIVFTKIPHWVKSFMTKTLAVPMETEPLVVEICVLHEARARTCNDGFNIEDDIVEPGVVVTLKGVQANGMPCEVSFGLSCEGAGQFAKGVISVALDSAKEAGGELWKLN